MVQIFQRESIFCDKISSGESLFIEKLVPGGTNFGGSIFTMTVVPTIGPLWASAPQTPQAHLIRYYPTYRLLYLGWRIATFTHPPSIIHHWMHIQYMLIYACGESLVQYPAILPSHPSNNIYVYNYRGANIIHTER